MQRLRSVVFDETMYRLDRVGGPSCRSYQELKTDTRGMVCHGRSLSDHLFRGPSSGHDSTVVVTAFAAHPVSTNSPSAARPGPDAKESCSLAQLRPGQTQTPAHGRRWCRPSSCSSS